MSRAPRRLPDPDRQPRGRHAARAQRAARGRRRRLRGHPPHARAARPLRRRRPSSSATTSTTSARARPSWSSGCSEGDVVALVSDAGMPLVSDPGLRARQRLRRRRARGRGPAGAERRAVGARRLSALPADTWRFVGFLPRKRGELATLFARAGDARRVRVAQPRRRVAGRARRGRPRAPGRRLPRADEAPRGGRARQRRPSSPSATPARRRAARSCSSSAARRPSEPELAPALARAAPARRGGREAARGEHASWRR